jgi:CheY-like chemotaxis protein
LFLVTVTASSEKKDINKGLQMEANRLLVKPIDSNYLLNIMETMYVHKKAYSFEKEGYRRRKL